MLPNPKNFGVTHVHFVAILQFIIIELERRASLLYVWHVHNPSELNSFYWSIFPYRQCTRANLDLLLSDTYSSITVRRCLKSEEGLFFHMHHKLTIVPTGNYNICVRCTCSSHQYYVLYRLTLRSLRLTLF